MEVGGEGSRRRRCWQTPMRPEPDVTSSLPHRLWHFLTSFFVTRETEYVFLPWAFIIFAVINILRHAIFLWWGVGQRWRFLILFFYFTYMSPHRYSYLILNAWFLCAQNGKELLCRHKVAAWRNGILIWKPIISCAENSKAFTGQSAREKMPEWKKANEVYCAWAVLENSLTVWIRDVVPGASRTQWLVKEQISLFSFQASKMWVVMSDIWKFSLWAASYIHICDWRVVLIGKSLLATKEVGEWHSSTFPSRLIYVNAFHFPITMDYVNENKCFFDCGFHIWMVVLK